MAKMNDAQKDALKQGAKAGSGIPKSASGLTKSTGVTKAGTAGLSKRAGK